MMHLVTGGSGSGKSDYAERLVLDLGERRRIYIATMIPYGEEGKARVRRHRAMRSKKQFETVECYTNLAQLLIPPDCSVLLECVSNVTANEMYDPSGAGAAGTVAAVVDGIRSLHRQAENLIVVTNEIFSDGIPYDASTMQYMEYLGEINRQLAREADFVTEVVYGIPLPVKGTPR